MNWRPWLELWSEEWITGSDPGTPDPEVVRQRWLGYAPATEADVVAAEQRLGRRLPPSYRDFLLTTDGWRDAGMFVRQMRDTTDLGWLRELDPTWEESWVDLLPEESWDEADNAFGRGLLISREADVGVLFLDPGDCDENGEWAAYSVFSWRGEPTRYASFAELMESLYRELHQLLHPAGDTRDRWDLAVEQARGQALSGDVDAALTILSEAEDFGRPRATVLRVQLRMFLADASAYEASRLLSGLLPPTPVPDGFFAGALFAEEFLPCLFLTHATKESWYGSALESAQYLADRARAGLESALEIARKHAADEPSGYSALEVAELLEITRKDEGLNIGPAIERYRARVREPGHRLTYGNEDFDTAVRDALAEHRSDPAALWQALVDAMPLWRPRTADHLAPIALLAEPAIAQSLTSDRGRALLSRARGDH